MPLNCALRNGSRGEFYVFYISYHNQAKTSEHWAHILALLIGCVTLNRTGLHFSCSRQLCKLNDTQHTAGRGSPPSPILPPPQYQQLFLPGATAAQAGTESRDLHPGL